MADGYNMIYDQTVASANEYVLADVYFGRGGRNALKEVRRGDLELCASASDVMCPKLPGYMRRARHVFTAEKYSELVSCGWVSLG